MTRQKVRTILGAVLAFGCVANAGFAQTQATASSGTQASGDRDQSAAAMAQQASNPFASSWALQVQQNNNWTEMPGGDDHTRVQGNLLFQRRGITCAHQSPPSTPVTIGPWTSRTTIELPLRRTTQPSQSPFGTVGSRDATSTSSVVC